MDSWLTLLPPVIAIVLAITLRQVYLAIFSGVLAGSILLQGDIFSGFTASFDAVAKTFESGSSVKSLIFILMIGALINVMYQSGGVHCLIEQLSEQQRLVKSKRSAQFVAFLMGLLMCLEGVGSMMMVGLVGRPLFAKQNISKAKLAYIANSTGAPLAWLLPVSGAGVLLASLVSVQVENGTLSGEPMGYIFAALPYQFYTIIVLASVPLLAMWKHDFQPAHSEYYPLSELNNHDESDGRKVSVLAVMLPVVLLLGSIVLLTLLTGNGNPLKGNISGAIYWSGFIALIGSGITYIASGVSLNCYIEWCIDGFKNMQPAVIILVLAFTLSGVIGQLGTGAYLAGFVSASLPVWLIPVAIFLIGMAISFSTGSSGATVSILTPMVIPLAIGVGVPVPVAIGTVISGAVFGDQSSPISDSVIVASSAADCRPEQHFITQLPFTVSFAVISMLGYLTLGLGL